MDFLILILAGIVVYYLYNTLQDYLRNPLQQRRDLGDGSTSDEKSMPQDEIKQDLYVGVETKKEEAKVEEEKKEEERGFSSTELGVMLEILKRIPNKEEIHTTFDLIVKNFIDQYFATYPNLEKDRQEALEFANQQSSNQDLKELVGKFFEFSYAEYKKRLRFVDFLLMMVYLDGKFDDKDQGFIKEVVSGLGLNSADLDLLYEAYQKNFEAEAESGDEENKDKVLVEESILKNLVNIFDPKNSSKNLVKCALEIARSIK